MTGTPCVDTILVPEEGDRHVPILSSAFVIRHRQIKGAAHLSFGIGR